MANLAKQQSEYAGRVLVELVDRGLSIVEALDLLRVDYVVTSTRYVVRGFALNQGPGYVAGELVGDLRLRARAAAATGADDEAGVL